LTILASMFKLSDVSIILIFPVQSFGWMLYTNGKQKYDLADVCLWKALPSRLNFQIVPEEKCLKGKLHAYTTWIIIDRMNFLTLNLEIIFWFASIHLACVSCVVHIDHAYIGCMIENLANCAIITLITTGLNKHFIQTVECVWCSLVSLVKIYSEGKVFIRAGAQGYNFCYFIN